MGSLPQKLVVHFEGTIWGENCHNFPPDLYNTFICSKTHLKPVNIYTHAVPLNILSGVLRVWHLLWGDELSPQAKYELKPAAIQILELGMYADEGTKREKGREGGLKVCANIWRNMYLIGNSSYSGILMQSKCTRSFWAL